MNSVSNIEKSPWMLEIIKQLLAYTTAIAALGYLFGRSYFQGYFASLGIDISFVQLSLFDYLESGWLFLWQIGIFGVIVVPSAIFILVLYNFLAPIIDILTKRYEKAYFALMFLGLLCIVLYPFRISFWNFVLSLTWKSWTATVVLLVILFLFRRRLAKVIEEKLSELREMHNKSPKYLENADALIQLSQQMIFQIGSFPFIVLFAYSLFSASAKKYGNEQGSLYLNEKAYQVELISTTPLLTSATEASNIYIQDDLRFLYFNSGRYFLSKLDKDCKPEEVLILDQGNITSIRMMAPSSEMICLGN